jgi:predicted ATPase
MLRNLQNNLDKIKTHILWEMGLGGGKTMLMDLFFECAPAHVRRERAHFHTFMQQFHKG